MPMMKAAIRKISVDRKKGKPEGVNVNLNIVKVSPMGPGVKIDYQYKVNYPPTESTMIIEGEFLYAADKGLVKKITETWEKDKKLPDDFASGALNSIMWNCSVHGTHLAAAAGLLPPVMIPKIGKKQGKEQEERVRYIG